MGKSIPFDALGELGHAVDAPHLQAIRTRTNCGTQDSTKDGAHTKIKTDDTYTAHTTLSHPTGASPAASPFLAAR